MNDKKFKKFLRETRFTITATRFEMDLLWEKLNNETRTFWWKIWGWIPWARTFRPEFSVIDLQFEKVETIGQIDDRPVRIRLNWWMFNGVQIMSIDCTFTAITDYKMINEWLDGHCRPLCLNGMPASCVAASFHQCVNYVNREGKTPAPLNEDEKERQEALDILDELTEQRQIR